MTIKLSNYLERACDRLSKGDYTTCVQKPIAPNPHIDFALFAEYLISRGKSERTTKEYLYKIHDFFSAITPETLKNYTDYIHFQTSYVNKGSIKLKGEVKIPSQNMIKRKNYMIYNCLRLYVLALKKREWLEYLPHKSEVDNPTLQTKTVIVKPNELKQLITNSTGDYTPLFEVLNCSGMRISECLLIRKDWIKFDLSPIEIIVPADISKGKKESSVFLTPRVGELIKKHTSKLSNNDFIFIYLKEEFDIINKQRKKNKIKTFLYIEREQLHILFKMREFAPERLQNIVSPHWFRHNYAQLLYANEVDLLEIQHLMRHCTPSLTAGYINVSKDSMKKTYKKSENIF